MTTRRTSTSVSKSTKRHKTKASAIITFTEVKEFKQFTKIIGNLASEMELSISKEGIEISGVDRAHICSYHFEITTKNPNLSIKTDKRYSIIVSTQTMNAILSDIKLNDKLKMVYNQNTETLSLKFTNIALAFDTVVIIPLIDIEFEKFIVPIENTSVCISLHSEFFYETTKRLSNVSDVVNYECIDQKDPNSPKMKFILSVGDGGATGMTMTKNDLSFTPLKNYNGKTIKCKYSLKYLKIFSEAKVFSEEMNFLFWDDETNSPILCAYNFDGGKISFILAPQFQEEEEH